MSLLLAGNWEFGTNELIGLLSATFTLLAVCVSLYLSQKSKTLKYKILGSKINKSVICKEQYQQVEILNKGHIKFTFSSIGYLIGKKYYFTYYIRGLKKLDEIRIENTGKSNRHVSNEFVVLPTYIHEGDLLQIALHPADFDFENENRNKRVNLFVVINGKIYKKSTGLRVKEFNTLIKDFNQKSVYADKDSKIGAQNIKNIYLR